MHIEVAADSAFSKCNSVIPPSLPLCTCAVPSHCEVASSLQCDCGTDRKEAFGYHYSEQILCTCDSSKSFSPTVPIHQSHHMHTHMLLVYVLLMKLLAAVGTFLLAMPVV